MGKMPSSVVPPRALNTAGDMSREPDAHPGQTKTRKSKVSAKRTVENQLLTDLKRTIGDLGFDGLASLLVGDRDGLAAVAVAHSLAHGDLDRANKKC
jgi:hypothetical protein